MKFKFVFFLIFIHLKFSIFSQTLVDTSSSKIEIIRFETISGITAKNDSIWDITRKIFIPIQPTVLSISLKDTESDNDIICIIKETIKIYDTVRVINNTVNFINLTGGDYNLRFIDTKNKDEAKVNFSIQSVFWERWWFSPFIFLVISVVLGIIFYFLSLIRLRQQLRLQSVRHELEIKALRAQMNPHFIFNCMNTIDAYILRKKFLEASDYLQKFSKLIRKI